MELDSDFEGAARSNVEHPPIANQGVTVIAGQMPKQRGDGFVTVYFHLAGLLDLLPLGRPPSLPLARTAAAFLGEVREPRIVIAARTTLFTSEGVKVSMPAPETISLGLSPTKLTVRFQPLGFNDLWRFIFSQFLFRASRFVLPMSVAAGANPCGWRE